jgi:2-polyprenyl-3-methyl-5-hydroxy-6-metoxy-1,4-benzoquinol methylase
MKWIKQVLYACKVWYRDIFTYPRNVLDITTSLDYDKYWEYKRGSEIGVLSDWQKERADFVAFLLKETSVKSLGDVGCGEGSILKYLQEKLSIQETIGYDSSILALEKAQAIGVTTIVQKDVQSPEDLTDIQEVDYYIAFEILEHISESERVLDVLYKKSNHGVFFSFPNSGFFTYRLRLLFGKFPKQWTLFPNEHIRFWTDADVRYWLRALGYTNYVIFHYQGVPGLNRLLPALFAAGIVVFLKK